MSEQARRLERNPNDKVIAGVASGVADFFGINRTIVRVIWALSIFFGGLGVIVYIVLWIVMPEAGTDRTVAHDLRDKTTEASAPAETRSFPDTAVSDTDHLDAASESGSDAGSESESDETSD
ncbi:MAG: PspC domain-containing protein [Acidimicrobiia bacterium]